MNLLDNSKIYYQINEEDCVEIVESTIKVTLRKT